MSNQPEFPFHAKPLSSLLSPSIERDLDRVFQENSHLQRVLKMMELFSCIKKDVEARNDFMEFELSLLSHIKREIYKQKKEGLCLKVEIVCFTGMKWTGPHKHSQYIVEQILKGTLCEQKFSLSDQGYQVGECIFRGQGDRRFIDDPLGHPHNVTAVNGPCISLSMTLGEEGIIPIDIADYKEIDCV